MLNRHEFWRQIMCRQMQPDHCGLMALRVDPSCLLSFSLHLSLESEQYLLESVVARVN